MISNLGHARMIIDTPYLKSISSVICNINITTQNKAELSKNHTVILKNFTTIE